VNTAAPALSALPAASLLRLIWLASPALPVGGFSYSEGLEAAVDFLYLMLSNFLPLMA
jgi:urease accessory protein